MAFPDYRYRPAKGQWKLERGEADQRPGSKMSSGSRNAGLYSPEPPPPPQMMASRLDMIYWLINFEQLLGVVFFQPGFQFCFRDVEQNNIARDSYSTHT